MSEYTGYSPHRLSHEGYGELRGKLPKLHHQWVVIESVSANTMERMYCAVYRDTARGLDASTGWCGTPEALAAALALIDPTLEG